MKIRQGFVSNSSSSSFVVAFPSIPKSSDDVHRILFNNDKKFNIEQYDRHLESSKASNIVYDAIKNQNVNDKNAIIESIGNGWFDGKPEMEKFKNSKGNVDWNAYEEASNKKALKIANKFIKDNKDAKIYVFSFSDNDGDDGVVMEHGEIFNNLPHIQTSYH